MSDKDGLLKVLATTSEALVALGGTAHGEIIIKVTDGKAVLVQVQENWKVR